MKIVILLGTWQAPANVTKEAVISAIRDGGYRLIDTANDYGNEHEVTLKLFKMIMEMNMRYCKILKKFLNLSKKK